MFRLFSRHKHYVVAVLFCLFTAFFCFNAVRVAQYGKLVRAEGNYLSVEKPLYEFDPVSGFKYAPNLTTTAVWKDGKNETLRSNTIGTNIWGHRSPHSPALKKEDGVFRIAVLGDSLTACIHNNDPWPTILERVLNESGDSRYEVLNFARDGIGIEQFPAIVENEVLKFTPDLVLVNFITADIYRAFVWRKTVAFPNTNHQAVLNCTSLPAEFDNPDCHFAGVIVGTGDTSDFKRRLANLFTDRFQWFRPRLTPLPTSEIANRKEALERSAKALKRLASQNVPILYLHLPTYPELVEHAVPKLVGDLMEKVPNLSITPMISFLPNPQDKADLDDWINFPTDMHLNDLGAEVYARAIHQRLKLHFLTTSGTITALR